MFRRCTFWSWWVLQCALLWLGPATCQASRLVWAGRQPKIDLPSPYLTQTNTVRQSTVLQPFLSYSAIRAELQHFNTTFTALPANDKQVFVWLFISWEWVLVPASLQRRVQILWFWAMSRGCGGGRRMIYLIYWSTVPRKLSNWEATRPMAMMPAKTYGTRGG